MSENDIKRMVLKYLIKNNKHFIAVPEVGISNNSNTNMRNKVRADIFAVNGDITIYEIKSEKDNLNRLENQLKVYQLYANKVYVVVADKFVDKLKIDDHIGIYKINNNKIELLKEAKYNEILKERYLEYWWGMELKKIFRGCRGSNTLTYNQSIEKLDKLLTYNQLKKLTLFRLKERYEEEFNKIKEAIKNNSNFPKREYKQNINVTPLKDIPFGVINEIC